MKVVNSTNNQSFGMLKVKGGTKIIRQALENDSTIKSLTSEAENLYKKDLLINVHKRAERYEDTFKPILSVDRGFLGNLLTKVGLGEKLALCHHHSEIGILSRCNNGILNNRKITNNQIFESLNVK